MGEHYKEKNVRKWKESLQDRRKQFAREAIHERYEKIVANRVVSRVPHLRSVHRQRLLNFVELENARVAAYRYVAFYYPFAIYTRRLIISLL